MKGVKSFKYAKLDFCDDVVIDFVVTSVPLPFWLYYLISEEHKSKMGNSLTLYSCLAFNLSLSYNTIHPVEKFCVPHGDSFAHCSNYYAILSNVS